MTTYRSSANKVLLPDKFSAERGVMASRVFTDKSKSIEELTGNVFSSLELQSSLSTKCFSFVKAHVANLNAENLRMLIGLFKFNAIGNKWYNEYKKTILYVGSR